LFVINNERGIALVITLLVIVLLTITVIEFTYSVQVDQHMAHNALSGLQASLLARSGINLGEAFLLHDDKFDVDAFTEEWCPDPGADGHSCRIDETNGQVLLPQNMRLRVQIVDEGGKLNLNSVRFRNPDEWKRWRNTRDGEPRNQPHPLVDWKTAFEQLLSSRGLDPTIADQVLDYWDAVFQARFPNVNPGGPVPTQGQAAARIVPTPDAATSSQLQQLEFASLDDAAVIPGLTASAIRKLRPVLAALPNIQQRVNANTAPAEVLRAIVDDEEAVSNILSQRSQTPLKQADLGSLVAGLNKPNATSRNYAAAMLGVTTQFFQVSASGVVNPNPVTGRGGIGRSATMLVRRIRRTVQGSGASAVPWTLTQLDWQKEGGAILFQPQGDTEPGTEGEQAVPRSSK
jgi:type II secretory pathway component PulK